MGYPIEKIVDTKFIITWNITLACPNVVKNLSFILEYLKRTVQKFIALLKSFSKNSRFQLSQYNHFIVSTHS